MSDILRHVSVLTLIGLIAVSCGGGSSEAESTGAVGARDSEQTGEVIGIRAYFYLDESGKYSPDATYAGSVVVLLPDESEVVANCTQACLLEFQDIRESFFEVDPSWTGPPVVTIFDLDQPRDAMLTKNEAGEWEVVEILE